MESVGRRCISICGKTNKGPATALDPASARCDFDSDRVVVACDDPRTLRVAPSMLLRTRVRSAMCAREGGHQLVTTIRHEAQRNPPELNRPQQDVARVI